MQKLLPKSDQIKHLLQWVGRSRRSQDIRDRWMRPEAGHLRSIRLLETGPPVGRNPEWQRPKENDEGIISCNF